MRDYFETYINTTHILEIDLICTVSLSFNWIDLKYLQPVKNVHVAFLTKFVTTTATTILAKTNAPISITMNRNMDPKIVMYKSCFCNEMRTLGCRL